MAAVSPAAGAVLRRLQAQYAGLSVVDGGSSSIKQQPQAAAVTAAATAAAAGLSPAPCLRIAVPAVTMADPHDCTDNADTLSMLGAVFDALVAPHPKNPGEYLPALAVHWSLDEDCRCWSFELRSGVTFHNGEPCDAEAMAYTLRRMTRPDIGATLGAPAVWAQYLGGANIEVVGPLSLRLTTRNPTADLLDVLQHAYAVPPALLSTPEGGVAFKARPIGTGPYSVAEFAPPAKLLVRIVKDHWSIAGPAPPHSWLQWTAATSPSDRIRLVEEGECELATRVTAPDLPSLGPPTLLAPAVMAPGLRFHEYLDPTCIILLFNCGATSGGPCSDVRVRRALSLAVERSELVHTVLGGWGRPLHGCFSPSALGGPLEVAALESPPATDMSMATERSSLVTKRYNQARSLLEAAGYGGKDGVTLQLRVDCPTRLPDEAQTLIHAVGMQFTRVFGPAVSLSVRVHADRVAYAHMVRRSEIGDLCVFDSSPQSAYRVLREKIDSRVEGAWWQGYHNPELNALLDVAAATPLTEARSTLYRQCMGLLQVSARVILCLCWALSV
jgi:peptide/nickel transport system substrate-binding protein